MRDQFILGLVTLFDGGKRRAGHYLTEVMFAIEFQHGVQARKVKVNEKVVMSRGVDQPIPRSFSFHRNLEFLEEPIKPIICCPFVHMGVVTLTGTIFLPAAALFCVGRQKLLTTSVASIDRMGTFLVLHSHWCAVLRAAGDRAASLIRQVPADCELTAARQACAVFIREAVMGRFPFGARVVALGRAEGAPMAIFSEPWSFARGKLFLGQRFAAVGAAWGIIALHRAVLSPGAMPPAAPTARGFCAYSRTGAA